MKLVPISGRRVVAQRLQGPQTMTKTSKLLIFGDQDFAQLAYEYFTHDSPYEVVAFTVDRSHLRDGELFGRPVVPFDELEARYPPEAHSIYVAIVYGKLNRVRAEVCDRAKALGYRLASYVSTRASVWHNVKFGEHCFVFEDNTIQPFVTIGDNVVLWSGNHVGHHSRIGNHCFITSHVVISGWCEVGDYCFLGVNSTLANNTSVGAESWISHAAVLSGDVPPHSLVRAPNSEISPLNEAVLFRSLARASKARQR
ncbi:MAG TPA: acetyltransferase [Burkholderiales bacterium]|nr:acetyltransferase [Burkholderiales bacterium]